MGDEKEQKNIMQIHWCVATGIAWGDSLTTGTKYIIVRYPSSIDGILNRIVAIQSGEVNELPSANDLAEAKKICEEYDAHIDLSQK